MKRVLIIITTLFLNISMTPLSSETKLHISTGFTPPVSDFFQYVLAEADARMDKISISFEALPAERSLALAHQGINDGECCRIPEIITSDYPNLTPVNISFYSARFSAFGKKYNAPIKTFADLKPYSVGTVKGWKIAVKKINEAKPAEAHIVTTPTQLFQMLEQDRLDFGVVGYLSGLKTIADLKINDVKAIEPPLIEKPLYLMLHNKNKHLIDDFNKTLNEMNKDGTINQIYKDLIQSL